MAERQRVIVADWKTVERQYRAGVLTITEIAKEHHISTSSIVYRAEKHGWTRDLSKEVRKATRNKLVENLATVFSGDDAARTAQNLTDDRIVEEAARTQVEVVRQHQKTLGRGHALTMKMLAELEAITSHQDELEELIVSSTDNPRRAQALQRAISLASRITALKDLAAASRVWIHEERKAFSIPDESPANQDDANKTAEELRQEIMEDARKLGMELTEMSLGVMPKKMH